jgi:hypothetical protein
VIGPRLTPEVFQELLATSGLGEFVDGYRAKGYKLLLYTAASPDRYNTSTTHIPQRTVILSEKTVYNPAHPVIENFTAAILHEFGHVEANERGLDYTDERLAWEIAEEIAPVPLPEHWEEMKRAALATYGLSLS